MDYMVTLTQLTNSSNAINTLSMFTGAHNFMKSETENWVSFKFKGSKKANFIKITLNAMDTYDVEYGKITNKADPELKKLGIKVMMPVYEVTKVSNGMYADMLKADFEKVTGLYLSFN